MLRYQEKIISLRIWLMIGLLLSLCLTAHSERLPIRTYTSADGLAQDRVKRIVRDSRGFLWFYTADGLSRFDGYRFVTYDATQGLPFSSVNDLLETRAGVYWIASNGGGVFRFNPSASAQEAAATTKAGDQRPASTAITENNQDDPRFTVYPVGDKSQTNRVNKLYEDEAGRIWAGTDDGLFLLDETDGQGKFHAVDLGISAAASRLVQVWAFIEDQDHSLWIGTSAGLVRRSTDGRMISYPVQSSGVSYVWSLLKDHEGRLWVGHTAGLLILIPELPTSATTRDHLPWRVLNRSMEDIRQSALCCPPRAAKPIAMRAPMGSPRRYWAARHVRHRRH